MSLHEEIREQPAVIARLLEGQRGVVEEAARRIRDRSIRWVYLAARGTSDNAGLYLKYLWGAHNRLPVALAAPSLFSLYETPPTIGDALVVGISQSGRSPDIVSVMGEGRRQGALTLALTNDPASPLAAAAELVVDVSAGSELAVAATKSYTAELTAIAMLSAALADSAEMWGWLERLPGLLEDGLALEPGIERLAVRYRYMTQCAVLGRGFNYATAFEWAIKLKEMAYIAAEPYSSADFQHGPVALAHQGFPIFALVFNGRVADNTARVLAHLVRELRVELMAISNHPSTLELATSPLALPADLPEWLSPVPAIVPAQLFCRHVTLAKGFDTDNPRGLTKVTLTW